MFSLYSQLIEYYSERPITTTIPADIYETLMEHRHQRCLQDLLRSIQAYDPDSEHHSQTSLLGGQALQVLFEPCGSQDGNGYFRAGREDLHYCTAVMDSTVHQANTPNNADFNYYQSLMNSGYRRLRVVV